MTAGTAPRLSRRYRGALARSRDQPLEHGNPPVGPSSGVDRVLGVRHQAEHVARLVRDARDPVEGAVDVLGVAERDLAALLELGEERRRPRPSCPRRA